MPSDAGRALKKESSKRAWRQVDVFARFRNFPEVSGAPKLRQELAISSDDRTPVGRWLAARFSLESQGLRRAGPAESFARDSFGFRFGARGTRCERSNTSQLSARRRKFRANAGPARGFRTSSQLLRLQVLRVGRAAKLAALKLRVSRAGRVLLGLARGAPGSPKKLREAFGAGRQEPADPRKCSCFRLDARGARCERSNTS